MNQTYNAVGAVSVWVFVGIYAGFSLLMHIYRHS